LPPAIKEGSREVQTFLAGNDPFMVSEIEVFEIIEA
jgi:hypothetical protein